MSTSQSNKAVLEKFYISFQKLDHQGMIDCYHPEVQFSDPIFPNLECRQVSAMWTMLCNKAKNFELSFSNVRADEHQGTVTWEAKYDFTTTGRPVHNKITARFEFKDGKIIKHTDAFPFWKWSRMALGGSGVALGWTPILRKKVQTMAGDNLNRFINSE